MKQGSRWVEELLVLYWRPGERAGVPGWRLFKGGNTLEEIVSDHNLRCQSVIKSIIPAQLVGCVKAVQPSLKIVWIDLGQIQHHERLNIGRPTILLLDLDNLGEDWGKLASFWDALSRQRRLVHLAQVRASTSARALIPNLEDIPCLLLIGEGVFQKQSEFEAFLAAFCQAHADIWSGIAQNPFDAPCQKGAYTEPYVHPHHGHFINPMSEEREAIRRVYLAYHDSLPALAAQARDAALARNLPAEQVVNLGRSAAIQELLLAFVVEKARRSPVYPVSADGIRQSLFDIPAGKPCELNQLQEVTLVVIRLPHGRLQPTREECQHLAELGLAKGAFAAVHYDRPALWDKIEKLGDLVWAETFTAQLPDWQRAPGLGEVGLSENSFGVRIEESFSRGVDHRYIQGRSQ